MDGILVCDKPAGPTSHDVVARVRLLTRQRRVGHAGTLDPPATGVLVLTLGRATRLLPYLPLEPKRYLATIRFGSATDTLDATGDVTATMDAAHLDATRVAAGLAGFVGELDQIPPMVSAVKVAGERLYAKARRGEEVERAPRRVTVHALDLLGFTDGPTPVARVDVTCSGGTYVRALADDLGRALGTVAHLAALRRTAVGAFNEGFAHTLPALEAATEDGSLASLVVDPAVAMAPVGTRALGADEAAALSVGRSLAPSGTDRPIAALGPDGHLVGVIQDVGGHARPRVVLG